jgi:hypothetical protein
MTQTATAPRRQQGQTQPPVAPRAFRVGVQSHDEVSYDETRTLNASTQDLPVLNVPPYGFLRHLYLIVTGTTAGNSANVTYDEDGPFNVIDSLTFEDVNSAPIVGPMTGWDLYLINKFGGYSFADDPKASPRYSAVTSTGATGGSFRFILRIPVELVNRDALGALPNKSGTAMFKVRLRLAASTTPYGTPPTAAGSVRIQIAQVGWWEPDQTDLKGRPQAPAPPAVQTTQFWSKATYEVNPGALRKPLERVGQPIRNLIFQWDAAGSRSTGDTDAPSPTILQFEANVLFSRDKELWKHFMYQNYGLTGGSADAADALVNGVYVEPFCLDFGLKPGAETRRGYLPTASASRLEVQGTLGGSGTHTLTVLTNDVAPARDEAELVA